MLLDGIMNAGTWMDALTSPTRIDDGVACSLVCCYCYLLDEGRPFFGLGAGYPIDMEVSVALLSYPEGFCIGDDSVSVDAPGVMPMTREPIFQAHTGAAYIELVRRIPVVQSIDPIGESHT